MCGRLGRLLRSRGILAKSHRRPASFEKVQMSVCTGRYPRRTVFKHHRRVDDRVLLCVGMHNADIDTFQVWTMLSSLDINNALAVLRDVLRMWVEFARESSYYVHGVDVQKSGIHLLF
jgi:hypothetical protein